ncbi:MAG: alanine/ornithine racemase family PLP-dependent enzyme [Bacteroidetes bacterium]|nr:alanine/ornithine racemase family PLP-dependent enzyme [Bacteroidota bacterium]
MSTPRIEINLKKIAHNVKVLKRLFGSKGIDIIGVTKVVCGDPTIAHALVKSGISVLADSRITNIKRMREAGIQAEFLLLRTPILSQAESVVKYADISLNSELAVIKKLSKFALKQNTIHRVLLMVELGDLREGLMPIFLDNTIKQVLKLPGIELVGIGTNLACFGGIAPDEEKMTYFSSLAKRIEEKFGITLSLVSGGNSANYNWFMSTKNVGKINNLRLGESIFLGHETLNGKPIPELFTDAFTLVAEVIEAKIKPSLPYGKVSQNASGNVPASHGRSKMKRVILGLGEQDVLVSGLTPRLDIKILGSSSDHIIVDAKKIKLKVGDELEFVLNYGALLSAMISPYVTKKVEVDVWKLKNIANLLNKNTVDINNIFQPSKLKRIPAS